MMTEKAAVTPEVFQSTLIDGCIPIPDVEKGFVPARIQDGVFTCYNPECLTEESFIRYLSERHPNLILPSDCYVLQRLADELGGLQDIPLWFVLTPKRIPGNGISEIERIRMSVVTNDFEASHKTNDSDYNVDSFSEIQDGTDPLSLAYGVYTAVDGKLMCLGTADLKYGAVRPTIYEPGNEVFVDSEYVLKFIQEHQTSSIGDESIMALLDEEELSHKLEEMGIENGDLQFLLETGEGFFTRIPQTAIKPGEVPVCSLIRQDANVPVTLLPRIEIGQFAKNLKFDAANLFVVPFLVDLYRDALKTFPDLVCGFSISPHFLRALNTIKRISSSALIRSTKSAIPEDLVGKMINNFEFLTKKVRLLPAEHTRMTVVKFKNGKVCLIRGAYQAETFENPAIIVPN